MSDLQRLFKPRSVAVVGASENQTRARTSVPALQASGVDLYLVNPRRDQAFGQRTYADLAELPEAVDAVFSLVNADLSIEVARTAAKLGVGGMVVNAEGFKQSTDDGARRARDLVSAASPDLRILGPNCNGYIDVHRGARLSGAPMLPLQAGPIGLVTHSGGLIAAVGSAGAERNIGFSHMISTGNELQVDMADCVEFLVDDPATAVIAIIVESARRPDALMSALLRARAANKPVLALKLGRSQRGQAIAESHTGAITGDAWAYDIMFEQFGVLVARDVPELLDKAAVFAQVPSSRWSRAEGVAVLGTSGGWAAIAGDVAEDEGVILPALEQLQPLLAGLVPDADVFNPLDTSGRIVGDQDAISSVVQTYASSAAVDTLVSMWFLDDAGLDMGSALINATRDAAASSGKPTLIVSIDDAQPGDAARVLSQQGVALGRGVRAAMRAIGSMGTYVRRKDAALGRTDLRIETVPGPATSVPSTVGPMLSFDDAMKVLEGAGIATAPYAVVRSPEEFTDQLQGHDTFVVKLADVPHRTDVGAVRLHVRRDQVATAVGELQQLAADLDLPRNVVAQAQLKVDGEAILAIRTTSPLGPFIAFGPGGVLVERGAKPAGALAPINVPQAHAMFRQLGEQSFLEGVRGGAAWDADAAAGLVAALSELAIGGSGWIRTLEINPLALVDGKPIALDCLCLTAPPTTGTAVAQAATDDRTRGPADQT